MINKLQRIDEFLLIDHHHLQNDDQCYFYGEYTARRGFSHSKTNDLILNFKKPLDQKGTNAWKHKGIAINEVVKIFTTLQVWVKLRTYTWVPIPPSKSKSDPKYDDRLIQTLEGMKSIEPTLDYRELVKIKKTRTPAHEATFRPKPEDHFENFELDSSCVNPKPRAIIIFDDVITTGSSFRAMKRLINETYPAIPVVGLFIARTRRDADPCS